VGDFDGRDGAALVLGASGGLGSAIGRELLRRGSAVALTYRTDTAALEEVLGERAHAYRLDLTDAAACRAVIDRIAAELGGVHTFVYAAGPHVPMAHLSRVAPEAMRSQLDADVAAFFNAVQPALPHLRAAHGNLVAVTTAATSRFPARDGLSSAPKAAIEALVRALAVEEGRFGVRANCVGPGGMSTPQVTTIDVPEGADWDLIMRVSAKRGLMDADAVAAVIEFVASDAAEAMHGAVLPVDQGHLAG